MRWERCSWAVHRKASRDRRYARNRSASILCRSALAFAVNTRGRSSAANAMTLAGAWVSLVLLAVGWPHLAPLERVTQSFTPFAPKPASKTVDQLDPVPAHKSPKCADFAALEKDEIWSSKEYNARVENFEAFKPVLGTVLSTIQGLLDGIADLRGRIAGLSPSAEVTNEFQVEHDDSGALLGVAVQMNAPDGGILTFDASGQLRESTLGDAQGRLFEALAADIQAVEEGAEVQLRSSSCGEAIAMLGIACGSALAKCLLTGGLGCLVGGAKCVAAALDWQCACMSTSC